MNPNVSPLLLVVSRIPEPHGRIERVFDAATFDSRSEDYCVAGDVWLGLDVYKVREKLRLVGSIRTTLELSCSRCLEPFPFPVDLSFDLIYLAQTENTGEGEIEVQEDELSIAFYRDDHIDLGQLMREQFYLALPMKPLCQEGCRGLCPECGANLNQRTCACVRRWEDPRLAGLKSLFKDR